MNLIDESFESTSKKDNSKKITTIILIIMVILIIGIISVFVAIYYMKESEFKLYINGVSSADVTEMMYVDDNGDVYFPIKGIAKYLGYESYNGEYTDKSEEASKCYVQCEDEIANFSLNSNKVYKLTISENETNYQYFYSNKPVRSINGTLYAISDAIENAFNISFTYDKDKQRVYIYTMPFLIDNYNSNVLDYGYEKISEKFTNKKTVLDNMLVVTKSQDSIYGVIDTKGNVIIEPKYDDIEYLPYSGDFLVTSNNKVGIISKNKEMKIQILYDSLELIDSDSGLYIAKRDNKYGIIDSKGKIKVYIEYDQIGIDNTKFSENEIKNKYLLDNGMIPARKDKLWGAFNKNGKTVVEFEYDSFGYVASTNKDAINLLLIPDYNLLVGCKNKKYALINSSGAELIKPVLDDVYMTINSGKKYYYMNAGDKSYNIQEFLDSQGVKPEKKKTSDDDYEDESQEETLQEETSNNINDNYNNEQEEQEESIEEYEEIE